MLKGMFGGGNIILFADVNTAEEDLALRGVFNIKDCCMFIMENS